MTVIDKILLEQKLEVLKEEALELEAELYSTEQLIILIEKELGKRDSEGKIILSKR